MKKKYSFQYTSTKGIVFLVLFGFLVTMSLSMAVIYSKADNPAVLLVFILAAFPIGVLSLKKLVIRKGEAVLEENRVRITLQDKEYDIHFGQIKIYFLENFQTVHLKIITDSLTVSIPVHIQFADYLPANEFFSDFQTSLENYAKKNRSDIVRAKHYFITQDFKKLFIVFFIICFSLLFYLFFHKDMSVAKGSVLGLMIFAVLVFHNKEKRKYDLETPALFYDHTEEHAQAKRKTIALTMFSIVILVLLVRTLMIVVPNLNKSDYITREYTNFLSAPDIILVDYFNSLINPYESINPQIRIYGSQYSYLALAIENDNAKAVDAMLRHKKIDFLEPIYDKKNPLLLALWRDNFKTAKVLIDHGAKVDYLQAHEEGDETLYISLVLSIYDMNDAFAWLIENYDINYKNTEFLKTNLKNLDGAYRDFFIFKLQQQLKALNTLDANERNLLQFTNVYPRADDQTLMVEKYLLGHMNYIKKYDQKVLRDARINSSNYIAKDEDEQILLDAYTSGNKDAALDLAWLYRDKKHYETSIEWFHKAFVVSKDGMAEYSLASMYDQILHDDANAIKYYKTAITKNNFTALAMLLKNHPEVNQDMHNDIALVQYPELIPLQKTALQNASHAIRLGEHYIHEAADYTRAMYWYEKALAIGSTQNAIEAKAGIANVSIQQKEHNKALEILMEITEYEDSKLKIATLYNRMKKYPQALYWYEKAWTDGYVKAAKPMGDVYYMQKKYDDTALWYKKAYETGDRSAAYDLAELYDRANQEDKAIALYLELYKHSDDEDEQMDLLHQIALIYHEKNDDYMAAAYYIATIDKRYLQQDALHFLKNTWKIEVETLKKAYELQKKLVKDPYRGSIN